MVSQVSQRHRRTILWAGIASLSLLAAGIAARGQDAEKPEPAKPKAGGDFSPSTADPADSKEAKDTKEAKATKDTKDPASGETKKSTSDLFLVVEAPANRTDAEVIDTFNLGIQNTSGCSAGGVTAGEISESGYQAIAKFAAAIPAQEVSGGEDSIEPSQTESSLNWKLHFRDPDVRLESIDLTYKDGDKTETKTFPAAPKSDASAKLVFFSPGYYVLKVEQGWTPQRYKLHFKPGEDGKAIDPAERKWPNLSRHFLIRIYKFSGDLDEVLKTMRVAEKVGNVLEIEKRGDPMTFLLATSKAGVIERGDIWNKNKFIVELAKPRASSASRVWMLFPITRDDMKTVRETLLDKKRTAKELAKAITDGSTGYPICPATEEAILTPKMKPTWFEIVAPPAADGAKSSAGVVTFTRAFTVEDVAGWKRDSKAGQLWRVVAWQFDPHDGSPLILYFNNHGNSVLLQDDEVSAWPIGLQKAPEK